MRIVFIGAVEFSLMALKCLVEQGAEVVGVCTLRESKSHSDFGHVGAFSISKKIPTLYVDDINSLEALNWISKKSPDVIFCFGWSRLIKKDLLELTSLGVIGFHPAALPANRGRHPIIWALVLGLKKTASTFFFMDAGADSGDILSQQDLIIEDQDDSRSLYDKITVVALSQITEFLPQLAAGSFQKIRQNDGLANTWRKRNFDDGKIDWRMSAQDIHNLVRGLSKPYIGAHFLIGGREIKVWKTAIIANALSNIEPGKVLAQTKESIVVKCGSGAISLLITEPKLKIAEGTYL
jgi:methionyl-tRNA formyltransferase